MSYLPPVYPADTRLLELRTAELLLVATLRLFVATWREPDEDYPDWRSGFRAVGILAGAGPAFETLFGTVMALPHRERKVCSPCCPFLAPDEGRLLQLVSLLQRARVGDGRAILADWLPASAARLSLSPAQELAAAMMRGDLVVPLRHAEAAIRHGDTIHADRGMVLLH